MTSARVPSTDYPVWKHCEALKVVGSPGSRRRSIEPYLSAESFRGVQSSIEGEDGPRGAANLNPSDSKLPLLS